MKKKFFIVLLLIGSSVLKAQGWESLIDSINKYKEFDPEKALQFGFEGLRKSDYNQISLELYEINFKIGEIYYLFKMYENSFKYLSRSLAIYQLLPTELRRYKLIKKPPWVLLLLGNVYYKNGRYDKSKKILIEAYENFELFEDNEILEKNFGLNTTDDSLGTLALEQNNFIEAEVFYKKSLERRIKFGRKSDLLFSYSLLINLYLKSKREKLALEFIRFSEDLYQKIETNKFSETVIFYAQIQLSYAKYLKLNGQVLESLDIVKNALNLINESSDVYKLQYNLLIAECLYELQKYNSAENIILQNLKSEYINFNYRINDYELLKKIYSKQKRGENLLRVNDSLSFYISKQNKVSNIEFSDLEIQLIITEKQRELNENQTKYFNSIYLSIILISLSVVIIILLLYYYYYQKMKNKRLELEKNSILIELDSKKRELVSKVNFIMHQNEFLKNLNSKVEKISSDKIKREINSIINSEKSYEEFDKMFTQVYPDFYKKMKARYNLSQTYLRLVAYIKMNQNNNEIAKMSGISLRTVETQRYRLSKILDLGKDQDLNTYIINF